MNNYLKGSLAAIGLTLMMTSCATTVVVRERPVEPVEVRPPQPHPEWVWVDGEWIWRHGHYVWNHGYWTGPHGGQHWHRGHWETRSGGYVWIGGSWGM